MTLQIDYLVFEDGGTAAIVDHLEVDGILSGRVYTDETLPTHIRNLFDILPDLHPYEPFCDLCDPDECYWQEMRHNWSRELRIFGVEWDPTIRF